MEHYVLDASALLVYLGFEPRRTAPTVDRLLLLAASADSNTKLMMSRVNWGELYYIAWRQRGQAAAEDALRRIDGLPIEVIDADREITKLAASLKATFGLGYADSFAAALAQSSGATVVAADRDFDKVSGLIKLMQLL